MLCPSAEYFEFSRRSEDEVTAGRKRTKVPHYVPAVCRALQETEKMKTIPILRRSSAPQLPVAWSSAIGPHILNLIILVQEHHFDWSCWTFQILMLCNTNALVETTTTDFMAPELYSSWLRFNMFTFSVPLHLFGKAKVDCCCVCSSSDSKTTFCMIPDRCLNHSNPSTLPHRAEVSMLPCTFYLQLNFPCSKKA